VLSLISNSFTLSFWLKFNTYNGNSGIFNTGAGGGSVFNGGTSGVGIRALGGTLSNFPIEITMTDNVVANRIPFTSLLQTGTWYNVVVTFDVSTKQVQGYTNAALTATATSDTVKLSGTLSDNKPYFIGEAGDTTFDGKIASVMLYNRVLSANEISQNFEALRGRFGI
jgi:hypothetical protein